MRAYDTMIHFHFVIAGAFQFTDRAVLSFLFDLFFVQLRDCTQTMPHFCRLLEYFNHKVNSRQSPISHKAIFFANFAIAFQTGVI